MRRSVVRWMTTSPHNVEGLGISAWYLLGEELGERMNVKERRLGISGVGQRYLGRQERHVFAME